MAIRTTPRDECSLEPEEEYSGELLARFQKNAKAEEIWVGHRTWKGLEFVDIRTYYLGEVGMRPGKGVSFRKEMLPRVLETLLVLLPGVDEDGDDGD